MIRAALTRIWGASGRGQALLCAHRTGVSLVIAVLALFTSIATAWAGVNVPINGDSTVTCAPLNTNVQLEHFDFILTGKTNAAVTSWVNETFSTTCAGLVQINCHPFNDPAVAGTGSTPLGSGTKVYSWKWTTSTMQSDKQHTRMAGTNPWHFGYRLWVDPVPTAASPAVPWHLLKGQYTYTSGGTAKSCVVFPQQGIIQSSSATTVTLVTATPSPIVPFDQHRQPQPTPGASSVVTAVLMDRPLGVEPQVADTLDADDRSCFVNLGVVVDADALPEIRNTFSLSPTISVYAVTEMPQLKDLVSQNPILSANNRLVAGQQISVVDGLLPTTRPQICLSFEQLVTRGVVSSNGVGLKDGFVLQVTWRRLTDDTGEPTVPSQRSNLFVGIYLESIGTSSYRSFLPLALMSHDLRPPTPLALRGAARLHSSEVGGSTATQRYDSSVRASLSPRSRTRRSLKTPHTAFGGE